MTAYSVVIADVFDDVVRELDGLIDRMLRNTSELWMYGATTVDGARPFWIYDAQNGGELVATFDTAEQGVSFMFAHRRLHGSTIDMDSIREYCPDADVLCVEEERRLAKAFEVLNR